MVRLKAVPPESNIKSSMYFNSTMVRLKAFSFMYSSPVIFYFNSTMVRLKALASAKNPLQFPNFNSTMVRLKETVRTWFREIKKFQFHYGTIKSRRKVLRL